MIVAPTRADIDCLRHFIEQRFGLCFDDDKRDQLGSLLTERLSATGARGFASYFQRLSAVPAEVRALIAGLTVGETYFFRYADHFAAFTEVVLPDCLRRHSLRILSAGCATGEEAHTLAMLVREHVPDPQAHNVTITGIDINVASLEKAQRGRYTAWSLRETPEPMQTRYLHADGREYQLAAEVRGMVTFEERNLFEEDSAFWRPGSFDVIFCRNVLIYLSADAIRRLIERLARSLAPSGYLFLGHAETLRGISSAFHLRQTHETFYYQRKESSEPVTPPPWAPLGPEAAPGAVRSPELASDDTWVDAIRGASERIAALASSSSGGPAHHAESPEPGWSLAATMTLFSSERFAEAMQTLAALPEQATENPDVQLLRAAILTNSGELLAAEQVCRDLLLRDELNAGAHYLTALCREHSGDRAAAVHSWHTAIYLDPDFAMPHLHLGLLAKRAGDVDGARRELDRALALLTREDSSRILLFGGGFSRASLLGLCRAELLQLGGRS